MKFDPTVSLGSILTIVSFIGGFILLVFLNKARIDAMETWKLQHEQEQKEWQDKHEQETRQRAEIMRQLELSVVKLTVLAEASDRRLVALESRGQLHRE